MKGVDMKICATLKPLSTEADYQEALRAAKRPKYKLSDLLAEMPEGAPRVEGWDEMPDVGREMAK